MTTPVTLALCAVTAVVSFMAFSNPQLMDRLMFRPERILRNREWYRIVSSALIHANMAHLLFNLITLYMFGGVVEELRGGVVLIDIYVASVAGGSLLSLWLHRKHRYAALGASGGVCGVMFAAIFLMPDMKVGMFFIPVPMPGPVFALCYLAFTFFALRRGGGNIGHDAHFGGAIVGLVVAAVLAPQNCLESPWMFGGMALLTLIAVWIMAREAAGLPIIPRIFHSAPVVPEYHSDEKFLNQDYNLSRRQEEDEIDRILEKVNAKGVQSLTEAERQKLMSAATRKK